MAQTDNEFQPDLPAIEAALTDRTRAIIVNTPNNPSGAVYTAERCRGLGELLGRYDRDERPLYLLCDDPYRRIIYDLDWCPTPVHHYRRTIIVSSYSKDLSIPGERAGYVVVPPAVPDQPLLVGAMTMLNRTLGFVNAPAFMQRVIARCADGLCDVGFYKRNRDLMCGAARVRLRADDAARRVIRLSQDAAGRRRGVRGTTAEAPRTRGARPRLRPPGLHAGELLRGAADD